MHMIRTNKARTGFSGVATSVVLAGIFSCASAQAQEMAAETESEFALWLAGGWSDNILRTSDAQDGNYQSVGVSIEYLMDRRRIDLGLSTQLEYRGYSIEGVSNEEIGSIDAFIDLFFIPERFSWAAYNSFGQGRTDPYAAVGPTNRQNINTFSTGPTLEIPLGARTELRATGLFSDYRLEDTNEFNSQTTTYELALLRQIGPVSIAGVIAEYRDIQYEGNIADYVIQGAVFHYEREFLTGDVLVELGFNQLVVEDITTDGPVTRFSWRKAVGGRSTLTLSASKEFTDAGAFFAFVSTDGVVIDREEVLYTPSPLEQARFEVLYEFLSPKTEFSIGAASSDETFESDPSLNNDSLTFRLELTRRLNPRMTVSIAAEDVQRDFRDSVGETGDRFYSLTFDWRLSRVLSLQAIASTYDRTGADFFGENRGEIRLRYEPFAN